MTTQAAYLRISAARPVETTGPDPEPASTGSRSRNLADRNQTRLLELLTGEPGAVVTIATMREHGVEAPAQAVYALQVAGYAVERGHCLDEDGRRRPGYRLRAEAPAAAGRDSGDTDGARR